MTLSEFQTRLRQRAGRAGVAIPGDFPPRSERYYELLRRWNQSTNLTGLALDGYPDEALDRLLVEPLQAAELIPIDSPLVCVDVGSGGGSPAIPVALARPSIRLVMVESVAKKTAFLREAVRVVDLDHAEVLTARAEEIALERRGTADLVLLRAVRVDESLSQALVQLLKPAGTLLVIGAPLNPPPGWRMVEKRILSARNELFVLQPAIS